MTLTLRTAIASALIGLSAITAAPAFAAPLFGDDNHDGIVMEDETGWDCATMGNMICGGAR